LVTSKETTRIEGGTSEKTSGNVEIDSMETPSASAAWDEQKAEISRTLHRVNIQRERNRLLGLFKWGKKLQANTQTIIKGLESAISVLDYINSDGSALSSADLNLWIKNSADTIEYAIELDKREETCTNADVTQLHELQAGAKARMETLTDELASRWPQPTHVPSLTGSEKKSEKVDYLMRIIDDSEFEARELLVKSSWNLVAAVEAHFAVDPEGDGLVHTNRPADTHTATTKPKSSGNGLRTHKWTPPNFAGPSGYIKLPKLTKEEEAAELVADKERVARLIRLNDEEDEKSRRNSTTQNSKYP
jgi:hypothetical protein